MTDKLIPPPPEKPTPQECCGGGCVPCIYDYYYDALDKWNDKYAEDWANASASNNLEKKRPR